MYRRVSWILWFCCFLGLSACATKKDVLRLETKIDHLIEATNRSTLEEIFGEQAVAITQNIDKLDASQRQAFEALQQNYQQGSVTLEDVREKMITLLGGGDRQVYTPSGVVIRNKTGEKTGSVPNGTKIKQARKLEDQEVPEQIRARATLAKYSWGIGEIDGETVMYPWELTISSFTKEIVEATARRTAQEFIRMGGDTGAGRPIYIQIETQSPDDLKVTSETDGDEIYLLPAKKKEE